MSAEARPAARKQRLPLVHTLLVKLGELWRARELLRQFVRKELKVRYRNSALGFLWSLLTPAVMTIVFSLIFRVVAPLPIDDYAAFFLSGYLLWQFFQNSCQGSIHSIVGNGDLIKKVPFPREVLPLSHVLAQLAHLLLALVVVSPLLIYARGWRLVAHLPHLLAAVALLTIFTCGVAMLLAAVNVPFRDLQELIVVIFLVWFYASPIVYPTALVENATQFEGVASLFSLALQLNPMTWFVLLFRGAAYGHVMVGADGTYATSQAVWPSLSLLVLAAIGSLVTFVVGYVSFQRLAKTFAKEL